MAKQPTPQGSRRDKAAAIMQARLSWPEADRYATLLANFGVLESGDKNKAVELLADHVPHRRATALVDDLINYGAMVKRR